MSKRTSAPNAQFKTDYKKTRKLLEKLEMQLTAVKNELCCLAHDPHDGFPYNTGAKKPPTKKKKRTLEETNAG
jgi:hypothetical protein